MFVATHAVVSYFLAKRIAERNFDGPNELVNGRPLGLAEAIGHVSVPVERPVRFGGGEQER